MIRVELDPFKIKEEFKNSHSHYFYLGVAYLNSEKFILMSSKDFGRIKYHLYKDNCFKVLSHTNERLLRGITNDAINTLKTVQKTLGDDLLISIQEEYGEEINEFKSFEEFYDEVCANNMYEKLFDKYKQKDQIKSAFNLLRRESWVN